MRAHLRRSRRRWTLGAAAALALAAAGCARNPEPAATPDTTVAMGDLSGAEIMVLPASRVADAQDPEGLAQTLDAEIEYWSRDRSAALAWTFPSELERVVARSPSLGVPLRALPVGALRRSPDFVADPLLGHLRRLGAVANRRLALLPWRTELVTLEGSTEEALRVHLVLVDTHGGRVLWRGAVLGEGGAPGHPATAASTARALARMLLP
ncbi:MAG TPA: hypothetical protein VMK65_10555 [Longimicrobiales bacterium]|nr:hypothetical protein [Longimicrobiales bacterium]